MPLKTYTQWYDISSSTGASGLAEITDAAYDGDPSGTYSQESYWTSHAYDALEAIFQKLGSDPGAGIDGTIFTINQDANNAEDAYLRFHKGSSGTHPSFRWDSSNDRLVVNRTLFPSTGSLDVGGSSNRFGTIYADEIDATTLTGATVSTGTTSTSFDLDTDETVYDAGTGTVSLGVKRDSGTDDAAIYWDEDVNYWRVTAADPNSGTPSALITRQLLRAGDEEVIDPDMLDATNIFAGSGGNFGTLETISRSDHSHTSGSLTATGTSNESFTVNDDWSSGSENTEFRFANSTYFIRLDPDSAGPFYLGGADWNPAANGSQDLGASGTRWQNLYLSGFILCTGGISTASGNIAAGGKLTTASTAEIDGNFVEVDSDDTNHGDGSGEAGLKVSRDTSTDVSLVWDELSDSWRVNLPSGSDTIALLGETQTLSAKTLSSPTLTAGGSWSGDPTFGGDPSFTGDPSLSGTPAFTGTPSFEPASPTYPFSVSADGTTKVDNLNADMLDNNHGSSYLIKNGSDAMTGDLDMGGNDIVNYNSLGSHASTHMNGGGDELSGDFGSSVTGIVRNNFRISAGTTAGQLLYLGDDSSHYFNKADVGAVGAGGSDVDLVPGSTSENQDLGQTGRRWRSGFFDNMIVLQELSDAAPSSVGGGSLWAVAASPNNDFLGKLRVRLNGNTLSVLDHNGKAYMTGSIGDWNVAGNLTVDGSSPFAASSHTHSWSDVTSGTVEVDRGGTGATTASGARSNLGAAASSHTHAPGDITAGTFDSDVTGADGAWNAGSHISVPQGSRVNLEGSGGNSYIVFEASGGGSGGLEPRIVFVIEGSEEGQLDVSQGFVAL